MYRVLIVEDEKNIREGIRYIIDSKIDNWTVSGAVADGQSALAHIGREPVEFILTDIKIPGMSGLELIDAVFRNHPRILTAVLSGYASFDYAHTALQYSVVDYVLKPTTTDKLRDVLRRAEEILETRKQEGQILSDDVSSQLISFRDMLLETLLEKNPEKVAAALGAIADSCKPRRSATLPSLELFLHRLDKVLYFVSQDLMERGLNTVYENSVRAHLQQLPLLLDQAGFLDWMRRLGQLLLECLSTGFIKRHMVVEKIRLHLEEHYREALTLASIAEEYYMNANYLSELFKKETGVNFNDYLTKVRIQKAKILLKCVENYKIYEIAHQTGYPNERYFTKVFKKATGRTPLDYRNQHSENM